MAQNLRLGDFKDMLPFYTAEKEGFRCLVQALDQRYKYHLRSISLTLQFLLCMKNKGISICRHCKC